jgi:hypothetical protein
MRKYSDPNGAEKDRTRDLPCKRKSPTENQSMTFASNPSPRRASAPLQAYRAFPRGEQNGADGNPPTHIDTIELL